MAAVRHRHCKRLATTAAGRGGPLTEEASTPHAKTDANGGVPPIRRLAVMGGGPDQRGAMADRCGPGADVVVNAPAARIFTDPALATTVVDAVLWVEDPANDDRHRVMRALRSTWPAAPVLVMLNSDAADGLDHIAWVDAGAADCMDFASAASVSVHRRLSVALALPLPDTPQQQDLALLPAVFNSLQLGIAVLDADGMLVKVNLAFRRIVGLGPGAEEERRFDDLVEPKDRLKLTQMMARLGGTAGNESGGALGLVRTDNRHVDAEVSLVRLGPGSGGAVVAAIDDVTDQRVTQERLRLLESAVVHANDAVLITDPASSGRDRKVLYVNEAFTRISGYSAEEIVGRSPGTLQGPLTDPAQVDKLRRAVRNYEPTQAELVNYHKNGNPYWIEISIVPVFDDHGVCSHFIAIQRDITERKRSENALREARAEAVQASSAKTRFLATASHDLRQPVQALTFLTSVLASRVSTPETSNIVEKIQDGVRNLAGLLDAILDISKLEAGATTPAPQVFNLDDLMGRILDSLAAEARDKGLALRRFLPTIKVVTDPHLVERVVRNLLSNAIRYTQEGGLILGLRRRGASVRIEVWDTGLGIPPEKVSEVFEEFRQLHNPERDRQQGLGLGLAIVERIALLLDADVEVRSRLGVGSCFTIVLNDVITDAAIEAPSDDAEARVAFGERPLGGLFGMVVEDEAIVRDSLSLLLRDRGAEVVSARNYDEALSKARRLARAPDFLLVDYRLPNNQDGVGLITRLREGHDWHSPAVLITGETAPQRIVRANQSGHRVLHKPIGALPLLRTVMEITGRADAAQ